MLDKSRTSSTRLLINLAANTEVYIAFQRRDCNLNSAAWNLIFPVFFRRPYI